MKHLLIMAAGTGGHIFPGLAIAEVMQARGWTVSWLGTKTGMESTIVAKHGIAMDQLDFTGLRGKGLKHSVIGAFKLLWSFVACLRVMWRRKPDVVLGMGGYVTVPGGVSSFIYRKPLVLMNADAPLLLSNKILKPLATRMMFGLPSAQPMLSEKCSFTGNPIRLEISQLTPPQERYAGRVGALKILVVGGSLGAQILNETVPAALALIPAETRPNVTHQSGKQHVSALRERYQRCGLDVEVLDFIDDMPQRYATADLVICRAGAITLSELTAAGVASILVPFVASSTSHQSANAVWLSQHGGAIMLPQSELSVEKLAELLSTLTRSACQEMAQRAYQLGQRNASATIADILEKLVENGLKVNHEA